MAAWMFKNWQGLWAACKQRSKGDSAVECGMVLTALVLNYASPWSGSIYAILANGGGAV